VSARRAARLLCALLGAGSLALGFAPLAHATTQTSTLTPTAEAWYQPNPSCDQPTGCVAPGALPADPPAEVPTSPFPPRTLHVGYAAGQETARTYLALPTFGLTGKVTAAALDVPLDVAPEDGSQAPETAKVQVCLVTRSVVPADGSLQTPPAPDCDASALASYAATPTPHLHADLGPLLGGLLSARGVALLPDATKAAPTDVWRVVFSAHDRTDAAKTPPASLSLTLETDEPDGPLGSLPDGSGLPPVAPPVGTGFAPAPTPELPVPSAQPPAVVPQAGGPVALPRTVPVGYAYPGVWLLPLVFLVVVPVTARALTRDLSPPV
jgi:hypothetical protein